MYIACLLSFLSCKKQLEVTGPGIKVFPKSIPSIKAGTQLNLKLLHATSKHNIFVEYINGFGSFSITSFEQIENGLICHIPSVYLKHSGFTQIKVYEKNHLLKEYEFQINPGNANRSISYHIGPKALFIDRDDRSMYTILPTDDFGNPIKDYTMATIDSRHPKSGTETYQTSILHFTAHQFFNSNSFTGNLIIGSAVDSAYSKESSVDIQAGYASNFTISVDDYYPFADGRQHFNVLTSVIKDSFGNTIADGSRINIQVKQSNVLSEYSASTINGIASLEIENPTVASQLSIEASAFPQAKSNVLSLPFKKSIQSIDIQYDSLSKTITVGPIKNLLGNAIPDGTVAHLQIEGDKIRASVNDGMINYKIPSKFINQHIDFSIEVLGILKTESIKID